MTIGPPQYVDNDGDGYDDPEPAPMPDPGQVPVPDPGQVPMPDPGAVPVVVTVNIVGSSGNTAFMPNPVQALVGNTIVWMNADMRTHDIVLDDGTVVGNLAPGQTSLPVTITNATVGFHCTIHASMVGQVTDAATAPPTSAPDQSQSPPPASPTPPADDYGDGYEDDYYLRVTHGR